MMSDHASTLTEWMRTPIPDILWHYTNKGAADSITHSKKMWATDVLYMNDKKEFIHAQELTLELIDELPESTDEDKQIKEWARTILKGFFSTGTLSQNLIQVFALSFTTLQDSLSQWDRYGDHAKGIGLGFNLAHMRPHPDDDTLVTFAPCIYATEKKRELLGQVLSEFIDTMREITRRTQNKAWGAKRIRIWRVLFPKKPLLNHREEFDKWNIEESISMPLRKAAAQCAASLLRLCALCKHSGFVEESEWRLVLPTFRNNFHPDRRFKERNGVSIPYVEVALAFKPDQPFRLSQVYLGPGFDGDIPDPISELQAQGTIEVVQSEIPLKVT